MLNFSHPKKGRLVYECDRPVHFDKRKLTKLSTGEKRYEPIPQKIAEIDSFLQFQKEPYQHQKSFLLKNKTNKKWVFFKFRKNGSKYKLHLTPINNSRI